MQQQITVNVRAHAVDPAHVCATLNAVNGIARSQAASGAYIVDYDPLVLDCAGVIEQLRATGVEPAPGLRERLRLKLRCYRDAILREEQMNEIGWDSFVREIYVSRYRHRRHGRRDDRPRNWRHYSERTPD
tara:strand:+ start:3285 stop:3677 length:393 start_codon:yes stop_codon:yes gene_type:complete